MGVAGYKSIKETKATAEETYRGITKKWVTVAKPNVFKNWPGDLGPICSFCGKTVFEAITQMFRGKNAYVCNECVGKFNRIIETNKNED